MRELAAPRESPLIICGLGDAARHRDDDSTVSSRFRSAHKSVECANPSAQRVRDRGRLANQDALLCAATRALNADVVVTGIGGRRTIAATDLSLAPYETSLAT